MTTNKPKIHNTAIIEGNVQLGDNVEIGPYSIIKGNVNIGHNTKLLGHVVIDGDVTIGDDNIFYYFSSIGTTPQDPQKFINEQSMVVIGNKNIIREYATINGGTNKGNIHCNLKNKTVIGNNCYLMISSHVAHDVVLKNNVIISNNVALAGHITVGNNTIIGGNTGVHQNVMIGDYCMIGGMCGIGCDIPHYALVSKNPDNISGINIIGLKRNNFTIEAIKEINGVYDILMDRSDNLSMLNKINKIKNTEFKHKDIIAYLIDFIEKEKTSRGISFG